MPNFNFLRRVVNQLSRKYGEDVSFIKVSSVTNDFKSGVTTPTSTTTTIKKVIALPREFQVHRELTIFSTEFKHGGEQDVEDTVFVFNSKYIPSTIQIANGDTFTYNSNNYEIKSVAKYNRNKIIIVTASRVGDQ